MSDLISDPPKPIHERCGKCGSTRLVGSNLNSAVNRCVDCGAYALKGAAPSVSSSAPPDHKATTIRHQSDPGASSAEPAPPTEFACRTCGQNLAANGACYTCHPIAVPVAVRRQTHALLAKVCELSQEADKDAALQVAIVARLRVLFSNNGPAVRAAKARGETLETILGGNA